MALTNGPNLGLLVDGDAGEEHYDEILAQWRGLDVLVQCAVINQQSNPPGSPVNGDAYIVGLNPTGAWSGRALQLARWSSRLSAWEFFVPRAGWQCHVVATQTTLTYVDGQWAQREAPLRTTINNQSGTTYTLTATDWLGRYVRLNNAAAITVTVPSSANASIPVGASIPLRHVGAGQVILAADSGVTINVPAGYQARSRAQGSSVMLTKVGAEEWDLTGDLAAV